MIINQIFFKQQKCVNHFITFILILLLLLSLHGPSITSKKNKSKMKIQTSIFISAISSQQQQKQQQQQVQIQNIEPNERKKTPRISFSIRLYSWEKNFITQFSMSNFITFAFSQIYISHGIFKIYY